MNRTQSSMQREQPHSRREQLKFGTILWRALQTRCPNCGNGKLFVSYLKPIEACQSCGEKFGQIRSDDAAPWLTILIVGHIAVPIIFAAERHSAWPEWVSMTVWPSFAVLLSLLVLPRAKAICLSIIWKTQAPGSE